MSESTSLLSLPNELLDRIIRYLAPAPEDRRGDKWFWLDGDNLQPAAEQLAWKNDIQALRLTCKRLSGLWTTKAALFHDITLYVSNKSLENFKALSEQDDLSRHVRCIIFMRPQAPVVYQDPQLFSRITQFAMRIAYQEAFEASSLSNELHLRELPWNSAHGARVIGQLLEEHLSQPETQKRIFRARQLYSRVSDEEQHLLKSNSFVSQAAQCLSLCINADSIIVCNGNGSQSAKCWTSYVADEVLPTWLEQNHPDVGLKGKFLDNDAPSSAFQTTIFEIFVRSHITMKHLMFSQGMCWHPNFDFDRFTSGTNNLGWSHLQELKLLIYDDCDDASLWQDGLRTSLLPLLVSITSTLRSLHLSNGTPLDNDPFDTSRSSFDLDKVLALDFGCLKELHLCSFHINCPVLAAFIEKRPDLCAFELVSCLAGDDEEWPILFGSLKRHPQPIQLSLYENIPTNFGDDFTVVSSRNLEAGVDALYDYLHARGTWTEELEEMFGMMP